MRLAAVGDNCVDDYAELGRRFPGGNALNVAVYASRHTGVEASYVGVLGTDEPGDFILDQMRREGLPTGGVVRAPGETAVTTILVRGGDRIFTGYKEGVQRDAKLPDRLLPLVRGADLTHFTVWGWGRERIPELRGGPALSCDFSNQLDHAALEAMPHLDYSFFSGREILAAGADAEGKLRGLKKRTPGVAVMTLGEHGSLAYDGSRMHRGVARSLKPVDTLVAGDSFIAAFLCSHARGATIQESLEAGHCAAAEVCRRLGAWGG